MPTNEKPLENILINILIYSTLVTIMIVAMWLIGSTVKAQCDEYKNYSNYFVTQFWDWHIGNTYFNYQCGFNEGNQTTLIN